MSVTAEMISDLRRMVDEPTDTTYSDLTLERLISKYPLIDHLGQHPYLVTSDATIPQTIEPNAYWTPTYDLHRAAADIWSEKAAKAAVKYDYQADGGSYSRSQQYEHCLRMARYHTSHAAARSRWVDVQTDRYLSDDMVINRRGV